MMSCTRTCHFLFAVIFILSNPSLPLANPRNSSVKTGLQSGKSLSPNSAKPLNPPAETALCAGLGESILTPSVTYPKYVWSVRAMMFLQIFPDGKINGTLKESKYAKLNIEVVANCKVRIKGVASERYLAMEANGTLLSQVASEASLDEQKSIFSVQLQNDFYTFKNGNFFIAFKHGGTIKKNRADKNGRSVKRSTRFVLIDRQPSRKRRFPTGSDFRQDDLQRR